jgi:membrane-associated phospholipid phosphatase
MSAVTDFGDPAILLPLSVVMLTWLRSHGARQAVRSWMIAVGFCVALTALLKIILYACPPASELVSPSGHTSLSVLIYGAIVLVIAAEQRGWLRALILIIGASLIMAIAGSRLWVKAHSVPEVLIGMGIGVATLTLFAKCYLSSRTEGKRLLSLILATIVVTALLHGQELRAEALLHAISRHVSLAGIACIQ